MTSHRDNEQPQPTSQAPHQHPGASFAQLMTEQLPVYHHVSDPIIVARLDRIEGTISRLQETVNLLVERQGQLEVESGGQDGAGSDDEADELPLGFLHQPRDSRGKVKNPTKSDVEGAVLALVNGNVDEQQKKLAGIEKHVDTAIRRMKTLVQSNMVPESWRSQDESTRNTIMNLFLDSVSKSNPFVPLDECEKNWIARHLLVQKWNNIHTCNEDEESVTTTNDSRQRDEVTGSTGGAMSLCSSLQSREIVRQFSAPGTSASRSRPAGIPPAITREVSMHSVGTGDNASTNSSTIHSTTTTQLIQQNHIKINGGISVTKVCLGAVKCNMEKCGKLVRPASSMKRITSQIAEPCTSVIRPQVPARPIHMISKTLQLHGKIKRYRRNYLTKAGELSSTRPSLKRSVEELQELKNDFLDTFRYYYLCSTNIFFDELDEFVVVFQAVLDGLTTDHFKAYFLAFFQTFAFAIGRLDEDRY
ncbi:hypothetical protein BDC45DRAFT_576299 [Circinella umbellata]|nr:hypothetical protein BDC45DRAFT_576299 [Circinella umbellata]